MKQKILCMKKKFVETVILDILKKLENELDDALILTPILENEDIYTIAGGLK